jgi:hypothetical protein
VIRLLSSFAVALSLHPFFEFFRGTPHQLAAIKELEDAMPSELLAEDAAWFEAWKESGIAQRAYVPYFHQLSLDKGYRRCFDASAAMVAALHGAVKTAEEYGKVREQFGDTIEVSAQLDALRKLELNAEFRTDGDEAVLEAEIASGRPVLVGWLHRGDLSRGEPPICDERGCGHWSVVVGFSKEHFVLHDPMGTPNMLYGGHDTTSGGKNIEVPRSLFLKRWMVEGEKSGWLILVDDG